jgi:microcystin-dependent protein
VSNLITDSVAGIGRTEGPLDARPLNDSERAQVSRLLSDPFAFPQTFKAWLISFLESSDLTLPISSIVGLSSTLGLGGSGNTNFIKGLLPPGTILPWSSARIPGGTLKCDGVAYSRAAYAGLFAEIGTLYGSSDVLSFNVPDLRRRIPLGAGSTGIALGASDGLAEASRNIAHHHHFNKSAGVSGSVDGVGDHAHSFRQHTEISLNVMQGTAGPAIAVGSYGGFDAGTGNAGGHSHGWSGGVTIDGDTTGGGPQDTPSYIALNYIIVT